MSYVYKKDNKIISVSEEQLAGFEYDPRSVVRGYDGRLYFEDEVPEPELSFVKEQARAALKAHRKSIEYGGVMIDGQRWDTEVKDELRLLERIVLSSSGELDTVDWKVADGVYVELTSEKLSSVVAAFTEHFTKCFAVEQSKLAELDALETVQAVQNWQATSMLEGWD